MRAAAQHPLAEVRALPSRGSTPGKQGVSAEEPLAPRNKGSASSELVRLAQGQAAMETQEHIHSWGAPQHPHLSSFLGHPKPPESTQYW